VAPGFVDPHYHIESSRLTPARHAEVTVPDGLTTLVEDPHEACAVLGARGMEFFLAASQRLPQRVLCSVSSATPPSTFETTGGYIGPEEMATALGQPGILGLGELMDPPRLFGRDARLWGMIEATQAAGRRLGGHGGFLPPEVDAFAAVGVGSSRPRRRPAAGSGPDQLRGAALHRAGHSGAAGLSDGELEQRPLLAPGCRPGRAGAGSRRRYPADREP